MNIFGMGLAVTMMGVPAHAERLLTYDEALEGAIRANPDLAVASLGREGAEGELIAARGGFDPLVTLGFGYSYQDVKSFGFGFEQQTVGYNWDASAGISGLAPTGTTYSLSSSLERANQDTITDAFGMGGGFGRDSFVPVATVLVSQALLRGHRLSYNLQAVTLARQNLEIASLQLEQSRQNILAATAAAYWEWVYLYELHVIALQSVSVAEEALRVGSLKVDAGELAPVERTRLEAALVQAQTDVLNAENSSSEARDQLLLIMAESSGQDVLPATSVGEVSVFELELQAVIDVAMAQSLDLALVRAEYDQAEMVWRNARHATLPELSITGTASVISSADDVTENGQWVGPPGPIVGVSSEFSMPLGNRAARGEVRSSVSALRTQEVRVQEMERQVTQQASQQVRLLQTAQQAVALADANVRLADATLQAEEALFDVGRNILKDVLTARSEVARTRAEAIKARTDYRQAHVELLRLQGQLKAKLP